MSEEGKVVETNQPAGEEPKGSGGDEPRTYSQDDVDSITEKVRRTAEKRAADLEKQLDVLRKQSETEQEKAIREAREAAASEVEAKYQAEFRVRDLTTALVSEGLGKDQAERLAKLAGEGDVTEEVAALKEQFAPLFGGKKNGITSGGGVQGNQTGGLDLTDPETINRIIREGKYDEYRDRIEAARVAKVGGQGGLVRRVK